jgi:hypothetical protein
VFFQLMALVEMVNCLDGLFEAMAMKSPMVIVAMWMKKSCQVVAAWCGGWMSSISAGGSCGMGAGSGEELLADAAVSGESSGLADDSSCTVRLSKADNLGRILA